MAVHATKTKKKIGFKWDGANLRWVRDDRCVLGPSLLWLTPPALLHRHMAHPLQSACHAHHPKHHMSHLTLQHGPTWRGVYTGMPTKRQT